MKINKPQTLAMHTPDIAAENFAKLAALFPQVITETVDENGVVVRAVDPEKLAQEINTHVLSGKEERYQFTWADKRKSVLLANAPINKALRPCREESVDFDNTENLYIEGDNLDVLKLLRETYLNRIKMIYIDPPYNTGNDFIYNDDFAEDVGDFLARDGQYDEDGNRLVKNLDSNGRFHTDWLNMIYPRLRLARDLLTDDGVIFINIDENEMVNLHKICCEVFGECNDLGTIIWDKRNPKGAVKGISYQHEYIMVYSKNSMTFAEKHKMLRPKKNAQSMLTKAEQLFKRINPTYTFEQANKDYAKWVSQQADLTGGEKAYNSFDSKGDVYRPVSMAAPDKPETRSHRPLVHPITKKTCPVPAKGWRFPDKSMDELLARNEVIFGNDETTQPQRKYLLKENMYDALPSLLYYGGSDTKSLSDMRIPFDTPKVVDIVKEHIQCVSQNNDIILDFFSGSATTAHAVMQLNAEDGGGRKFICVQLPEECDEKSEAAKAGYKNICEIGKERIRRAGKKIKDEIEKGNEQLSLEGEPKQVPDIGFRVLKIDSSNMKDVYYTPVELRDIILETEEDDDTLVHNIKPDRTAEDLLFQVMLDLGVPLSAKIEKRVICGSDVYYVEYGDGYLVACFGKVNKEIAEVIAKEKPYFAVFRDDGFENDSALINAEQVFATHSPDTERRVL